MNKTNIAWLLAWSVAALTLALAVGGFAAGLLATVWGAGQPWPPPHIWFNPLFSAMYAVVGALIAERHSRNPIGWICSAAGVFAALTSAAFGYRALGETGVLALPGVEIAHWLNSWVWIPSTLLPVTFLLLLFPDGHLPSPRWWPIGWAAGLGIAVYIVSVALHPLPPLEPNPTSNPFGIPGAGPVLNVLGNIAYILFFIANGGSLAALVVRFRRSRGIEREQLKWLAYAVVTALLITVAVYAWYATRPDDPLAFEMLLISVSALLSAIAVATGIAILRYRLYDIDLVINRTLVYGVLTASLTALYGLTVGAFGSLFQINDPGAGLVLTLIVAVLVFDPARARLQGAVDHLAAGAQARPARAEPAGQADSEPARLPERWRGIVHTAWWAALALALGVVIASLPGAARFATQPDLQPIDAPPALVTAMRAVTTLAALGTALLSIGLAVLLVWRRRAETMIVVISFFLLAYGVAMGGALEMALGAWASQERQMWASQLASALTLGPFLLVLCLFPTGRFVPRWSRWLVLAALPLLPLSLLSPHAALGDPSAGITLVNLAVWALAFVGVYAQVYRYRHVSTAAARQQTKWFVFGLFVWIVLIALSSLPYAIMMSAPPGAPLPGWVPIGSLGWTVTMAVIPLSLVIAITRYRLWEVDLLINRALVYGALSLAVIALYGLLVGLLGALSQASGNLLTVLLVTGLAAVVFQPLRDRLQRAVNRLMYGPGRADPYAALARLGQRLGGTLAPEAVLPSIVETVAQTLKLPYAAISLARPAEALRSGADFPVVAAYGSPPALSLRLPLVYQAETIGALIVGARAGDSFSATDRRLLEALARQAGVAAQAMRLTADLQRSRRELVTAREEERRRLRRDLHDGLGSQFAALHLRADTLRALIPNDPATAAAVAVELRDELRAAVADIRRLVYELRPPALDELGLAGALRGLAAQCSSANGLRVTVEAPEPLPPLPAAVEVAAFRIAQEALANVTRHARARTCLLCLQCGDELRLEVRDDGIGLPAQSHAGVGLRSMRERAEELGGKCRAETITTGGTRVVARLPLTRAASLSPNSNHSAAQTPYG